MITSLFQQYVWVIGQLKDRFKMTMETRHRESHEFFFENQPKFKLLYGRMENEQGNCIVFCPHIEMQTKEAIVWFCRVSELHPETVLWDVYLEDDRGESYLGRDAYALQHIYRQKQILEHWLENADEEDMNTFIEAKVYGREKDYKRQFDAFAQREQATTEFIRIRKPDSDDEIQ